MEKFYIKITKAWLYQKIIVYFFTFNRKIFKIYLLIFTKFDFLQMYFFQNYQFKYSRYTKDC